MKNIQLQVPARVPRLYYGATAGQMELTGREKLGEAVYTTLALVSYILFLAGGVLGYFYDGWLGSITFTLLGYVLGMWMRRSLGMRGRKIAPGFFRRMRERAQGARPGQLERLIETISATAFTQEKCRAVTQAHEKALKGLNAAKSPEAQVRILAGLDRRVKEILYRN